MNEALLLTCVPNCHVAMYVHSSTCTFRLSIIISWKHYRGLLDVLAKHMQLRFPEQVVAVFADTIQTGEDTLVVHALALDVEERPFAQRMAVESGGIRAESDARRDQQEHQRPRENGQQEWAGRG